MTEPEPPSLREAARVWAYVAAHSFGGPAGQIAVMHRVLVEERRWVGEARFLHALNYCMLLPGPEAQQLATYLGWLLHGTRGGLVAGLLFILPGFLSILALSLLYVSFVSVPWVAAFLFGVKAAVLVVVIEAVQRLGRRVLHTSGLRAVAVLAFVGVFGFGLPFPVLVLLAGLLGWVGAHLAPAAFGTVSGGSAERSGELGLIDKLMTGRRVVSPTLARTLGVAGIWLAVWWLPLIAQALVVGPDHVLVKLGDFFSQAAVVTFGGAYAVLTYVAQQAVEVHGWLTPGEMLDGLAMAESTPGPLIQVVQHVGFLAAAREPGPLHPLVAGTLGAVVTTWVTFVPCFLWVFTGAPYVEALRGNKALSAALSTVTAAVVGAVLNLGVWLALHVLFRERWTLDGPLGLNLLLPVPSSVDLVACGIAVGAAVAMLRLHVGMLKTLAAGGLVGVLAWALG